MKYERPHLSVKAYPFILNNFGRNCDLRRAPEWAEAIGSVEKKDGAAVPLGVG